MSYFKYILAGIAGFGLCFVIQAAGLGSGIDVPLPDGRNVTCYNFGERWK